MKEKIKEIEVLQYRPLLVHAGGIITVKSHNIRTNKDGSKTIIPNKKYKRHKRIATSEDLFGKSHRWYKITKKKIENGND